MVAHSQLAFSIVKGANCLKKKRGQTQSLKNTEQFGRGLMEIGIQKKSTG